MSTQSYRSRGKQGTSLAHVQTLEVTPLSPRLPRPVPVLPFNVPQLFSPPLCPGPFLVATPFLS